MSCDLEEEEDAEDTGPASVMESTAEEIADAEERAAGGEAVEPAAKTTFVPANLREKCGCSPALLGAPGQRQIVARHNGPVLGGRGAGNEGQRRAKEARIRSANTSRTRSA
ncbi:uncharacterized protein FIBRA_08720 [Fibroporia radiculosa]|uniref:Uncharacterized protein n=1 Tax=Fibroporia radiculosa TaxID=599839 RepID=J4ICI2_9APHY|nr:uncharacterized protein FIBRA_08720 [Fibroporia radiculosa]CCM06456.1 predicted protein [Fibroporia radiculosa]